jgi:hypothetical protein
VEKPPWDTRSHSDGGHRLSFFPIRSYKEVTIANFLTKFFAKVVSTPARKSHATDFYVWNFT